MTPEDFAELYTICFPLDPLTPEKAASRLEVPMTRLYAVKDAFLLASVVPPEADIIAVGVHPRARRTGQARRLIETLQTEVSKIFLEVSVANTAAVSLYTHSGFGVATTRRNYYATPDGYEDALLMSWTSAAAETG